MSREVPAHHAPWAPVPFHVRCLVPAPRIAKGAPEPFYELMADIAERCSPRTLREWRWVARLAELCFQISVGRSCWRDVRGQPSAEDSARQARS